MNWYKAQVHDGLEWRFVGWAQDVQTAAILGWNADLEGAGRGWRVLNLDGEVVRRG